VDRLVGVGGGRTRTGLLVPVLVLALCVLLPFVFGSASNLSKYQTILINLLVVLGLNLTFGYAGELAIAQPVIMGTAAYAAGVLSSLYGWGAFETLPVAIVAGCVVAVVLNSVGFRVKGWYLAVSTFFAVTVFPDVIELLEKWTGGGNGLGNIPPIPGMNLGASGESIRQYELVLGIAAVVWLCLRNLQASPWGVVLRSLRDCRQALVSCGGNQVRIRFAVTVVGSVPVALAGWLFAYVNLFLTADSFGLNQLLLFMGAVLIGGRGTLWGPVVGTVVFECISLWIGAFSTTSDIVLGASVLVISALFPTGIVGGVRHLFDQWRPRSATAPAGAIMATATAGTTPVAAGSTPVAAGTGARESEPSEVILDVTGVSKRFGGVAALDGVDLQVRRGEVVGLVGPNGSGKTTLLNVITGFVVPDSGTIVLDGKDVTGAPPHAMARSGVRRSFQTPQLVGELSIADNVALGVVAAEPQHVVSTILRGPGYRRRTREIQAAVEQVCAAVGLATQIGVAANELPLGVRRIAEIGRAVVGGPQLLCLDEPAAGLPEEELEIIFDALRRVADLGFGVLLIEHNLDFVERVSDRVTVLENGRVSHQRVAGVAAPAPPQGTPVRVAEPVPSPAADGGGGDGEATGRALVVDGLSAWYGQAQALYDVSLSLRAGQIVGILGANGAGKSTLLRSVAGVHKKVQGSVRLGDVDVVGIPPARVAVEGITLAREGAKTFSNLSVTEHVEFAARLARRRGRAPKTEDEVWEMLPVLYDRRRQKAGLLSGGQRQLLALAMASVSSPECLLLDEPSAGLAESIRETVFDCIRVVATQGCTLLIAEQSERWLAGLADTAHVLELGRLVGTVDLGGRRTGRPETASVAQGEYRT